MLVFCKAYLFLVYKQTTYCKVTVLFLQSQKLYTCNQISILVINVGEFVGYHGNYTGILTFTLMFYLSMSDKQ